MKQIISSFILFIGLLIASVCPVFSETIIVTDVFTPHDSDFEEGSHHMSYNDIVRASGIVYSLRANNTNRNALGISGDNNYKGSIHTSHSKAILRRIRVKWSEGKSGYNGLEIYASEKPYPQLTGDHSSIYSSKGTYIGLIGYTEQDTCYDLSDKQITHVALIPHKDSRVCYLSRIEFDWEVEVDSPENQVATPTFDLDDKIIYRDPLTLHLSCTTPEANIYYTLDGTTPSEQSTLYQAAGIVLSKTTMVKAIALKEGMLPSPVAEATYSFDKVSDYLVYKKVTSTAELNAGDTFLLVGHDSDKDYVLSYQKDNNRQGLEFTETFFDANGCVQLKPNLIATKENPLGAYELELQGSTGKWLMYDPIYKGYLYAVNVGGSSNYMRTKSEIFSGNSDRESSYLDISFAEGGKAILDFHHGKLESGKFSIMCNGNIFSCYDRSTTTVSDKVYLYRKVGADEGLIRMSAAGCGTLYLDKAFTMPAGLQGGIITQAEGSNQLNIDYCYDEGQVVPDKTPLLIKGAEGLYLYRQVTAQQVQAQTAQQLQATNLLHGEVDAEGMTSVPGASRYYKLSYDSDGQNLGFYWGVPDGGPFKNSEGKAYLALSASAGALIQQTGFSLEAMQDITGISTPEAHTAAPSVIYLIDGRRVPTNDVKQLPKGLYIINGQKQLIP